MLFVHGGSRDERSKAQPIAPVIKKEGGAEAPLNLRMKILRYGLCRPQKSVRIKAVIKRKNSTWANHVAVPAIPLNPKAPATIPRTRKAIAQLSIYFTLLPIK
jgi:N-acyl-D-aspartate/D-glutamate deacylase